MSRVLGGLRIIGDLLITAGLVIALFAIYELSYTGVYTGGQQSKLKNSLEQQWAQPGSPGATPRPGKTPIALSGPKLGSGVAILRIPRLGRSYAKVVVEGVAVPDLRKGPGHYPGTAMPGAIGNFVVSGHRTTYAAPFGNLDKVRVGDPIVLETGAGWYVYRMTRREIVAPTAIDVIDPVPEQPGATPTRAMLTFTTCNPKYSARQRLVVFGLLSAATPRSAGPPAVLAG